MNEDHLTTAPPGYEPERPRLHRDPVQAVRAVADPKREDALPPDDQGMLAPNAPRNTRVDGTPGSLDYGEFDWPEGYVADPRALEKFLPVARELGLPKEGAQTLANLYAELDQERGREQARFIAENNARWLKEIQSHPEFGGRNLQETGENVAAMMRRYGTPLLASQIRQMNIQNWPEMFFFLARVSQAVTEDRSPSSAAADAPAKTTAQLLFPGLR